MVSNLLFPRRCQNMTRLGNSQGGRVVAEAVGESGRQTDRIFELLSDDVVKSILSITDQRATSAQALEDHCDASLATVYRRTEDLLELGLLNERTEYRSDGNHFKTYESNLDRLAVDLDDGDLTVAVDRCDDAPDRLRTIWDAMQPGWR